jgi:tetraacyldisaccharide 4'-kinase
VLTGEATKEAEMRAAELADGRPIFFARFEMNETDLPSGPALAFCGIGRPERFERSLCDAGAELTDFVTFADHHPISARELRALRQAAAASGAQLITTEKDYARLAPADRQGILPITGRTRVDDAEKLLGLIEDRL